ncbi:LysR family transcriptional regulator [Cupriavidus plantarum]|uniref:DNA-binding transcriptional LysR family regulator n=1 Tax=Cupriavidus plantarum TaxID=942865 RepID=A0A316EXQ9_9BURK|nr:LysR family transcriptional regulator [Cupriavidus plantarum]NYH99956.1 DNA-binding transcriptional LysR family regulator [Cupriavidus plantarum]PWK37151.1 DNA-binding transcriptional LysR family regulator [Cupriavidus plantarum]RLK45042.1 DNA-binding transcriptional LysR family regulator [Cupriavidus plantarum]CAG2129897.1 HTH-type transcriptional regulator CysL [Cupriavidus plantarum]SMR66234.1 DNA-binding transcriptional regulator, LysR family [Cupriavidus plantarum]
MFNPQWLRSFSMVAQTGSFTQAADQLGLTQAAVSQHIRHLEDALGPLLIRRPRAVELTPAGKVLLEYCADMEAANDRLRAQLSAHADSGVVGLITPGSIGLFLYPRLLDLQGKTPGLIIRHRFAPDAETLDAVLQNRFDVGLVSLRPDDARLSASPFSEEPLELVYPAGEDVRGWDDLQRIGFCDHPDGKAMANRLLSRHYPGNPGVSTLPCRGFSNQVSLMLEPVARGFGFTVIPRYARQAFARQDQIRVLDCHAPVIDKLWLIHRSEWALSPRVERVVDYLRTQVPATLAM